jgi:hypothetical protein
MRFHGQPTRIPDTRVEGGAETVTVAISCTAISSVTAVTVLGERSYCDCSMGRGNLSLAVKEGLWQDNP